MSTDTAVMRTEHPHVVRDPVVKGGQPIVAGTGVTVRHIAVLHRFGDSVEDIQAAHPDLSAAQIHDAISYYLDHVDEINKLIERNQIRHVMREHGLVYVVGRGLVSHEHFEALAERDRLTFYTADTLPREWDAPG